MIISSVTLSLNCESVASVRNVSFLTVVSAAASWKCHDRPLHLPGELIHQHPSLPSAGEALSYALFELTGEGPRWTYPQYSFLYALSTGSTRRNTFHIHGRNGSREFCVSVVCA